jgi:hypothetical protein
MARWVLSLHVSHLSTDLPASVPHRTVSGDLDTFQFYMQKLAIYDADSKEQRTNVALHYTPTAKFEKVSSRGYRIVLRTRNAATTPMTARATMR